MGDGVKEVDVASDVFVTRKVVADMGDDGLLVDDIILDGDSSMDNIITLQHIIGALNSQVSQKPCESEYYPNTGLHHSRNTLNSLLHL